MAGGVSITVQRRKLPRPRTQRAFLLWFREDGACFAVPIRLGRRMGLSFDLAEWKHHRKKCALNQGKRTSLAEVSPVTLFHRDFGP